MDRKKIFLSVLLVFFVLIFFGVIVSMFLNTFCCQPSLNYADESEIESECESKCQSFQDATGEDYFRRAFDYCRATFIYDADKSGVAEGQIYEQGYNSFCQDGVKCFNKHQCFRDGNQSLVLDAEGCIDIMCEYIDNNLEMFSDDGEEPETDAIIEHIFRNDEPGKGVGTCDLQELEDASGYKIDTWYSNLIYNEETNPCEIVS